MALTLQGSWAGGLVRLSFDIVNNRVVGAELVNDHPTDTYRLTVDRTRGNRNVEVNIGPGQSDSRSFPGNQRFDYDTVTAEWRFMVGPV